MKFVGCCKRKFNFGFYIFFSIFEVCVTLTSCALECFLHMLSQASVFICCNHGCLARSSWKCLNLKNTFEMDLSSQGVQAAGNDDSQSAYERRTKKAKSALAKEPLHVSLGMYAGMEARQRTLDSVVSIYCLPSEHPFCRAWKEQIVEYATRVVDMAVEDQKVSSNAPMHILIFIKGVEVLEEPSTKKSRALQQYLLWAKMNAPVAAEELINMRCIPCQYQEKVCLMFHMVPKRQRTKLMWEEFIEGVFKRDGIEFD